MKTYIPSILAHFINVKEVDVGLLIEFKCMGGLEQCNNDVQSR